MKKYSLTIKEHEEYGFLGIVVDTGRDYFEPGVDGLLAAHDILEHTVKPHSCGFTDELMALGGYIAGRVETGYISRNYRSDSIDNISSDIQSLFTSALNEDGDDNVFKTIEKCNSYLKDSYIMGKLKSNVRDGIIEALDEWVDGGYIGDRIDDYDMDSIIGWICKGYQLFKKRFSGIPDYCWLFTSIRTSVDNFLKYGIEGQSATLYVDFTSGRVFIEEEYEY
jgi:hypothetical protein